MNDEQILKAHMADMPVGDKIHSDLPPHDWLGAYLDDNKATLAELAQVISLLPGGATAARRVALFHWARQMGMRGITLCRSQDGQCINIECQQPNAPWMVFDESAAGDAWDYIRTQDVPRAQTQAATWLLIAAEYWLETGELAPVAQATFFGKTRIENGRLMLDARDCHAWDCTTDLFAMDEVRRQSTERHVFDSAWWQSRPATPAAVKSWNWDFMFTIFIHSPSEALLCMRSAMRMLRATPPAAGQRVASRL